MLSWRLSQLLRCLQSVLNVTKETQDTLSDFVTWRKPMTKAANRALFWLLQANVENTLKDALQQLYFETQTHNGYEGLRLLQNSCAPPDTDERHTSYQRFKALQILEGESINQFNTRFNKAVLHVSGSGKRLSSRRKGKQYFRALRQHPSHILLAEINKLRDLYEQRVLQSLSAIQTKLQHFEEISGVAQTSMQN